MKKKALLIPLVLLLAFSLAACAAPAPAPSTTYSSPDRGEDAVYTSPDREGDVVYTGPDSEAPAIYTTAPVEVTEWTILGTSSGGAHYDFWFYELMPEIKDATGGQLEFKYLIPGEHPFSIVDLLTALRDGKGDVAEVAGGFASGHDPRLAVLDLPLLIPQGDLALTREIFGVFADSYLKDVWAEWGVELLIPTFWGPQHLYTKDVWVDDFDDLSGVKVRTWSPETADLIATMGGIPMQIAWGEVYTSLQTGLIDAVFTSVGVHRAGMTEFIKNWNMIFAFFPTAPFLANSEAMAALPSDVRAGLLNVVTAKRDRYEVAPYFQDGATIEDALVQANVEVRMLPPSFREQVRAIAYEGIWGPWMERGGASTEAAFDMLAKLLIEKGHTVPGHTPK